jgi:hypothetical protein
MANFNVTDVTTGVSTTTNGTTATAPFPTNLAGAPLNIQFVSSSAGSGVTATDSVVVASLVPNVFIATGSGNDIVNLVGNGSNNVDAGPGANTIFGGTGNDHFIVQGAGLTGLALDVINGWHPGDILSMFGIDPAALSISVTAGVLTIGEKNAAGTGTMLVSIPIGTNPINVTSGNTGGVTPISFVNVS